MRYLYVLFLIVFQSFTAQNRVEGVFIDSLPNVKKVALYQFTNGTPNYISNTTVSNKKFEFSMDTLTSGYYRILYRNSSLGYVDFIYNKEDVLFTVDSNLGQTSIDYLKSKENQLLAAYHYYLSQLQGGLDALQMSFFTNGEVNESLYKDLLVKTEGAQNYYENLAKNDYCISEIKASKQYNSSTLITSIKSYRESVLKHFFDAIDFNNHSLKNSQFLIKKVSEYVFSLHQSESKEIENELLTTAINRVDRLIVNTKVKQVIIEDLLLQLMTKENNKVIQTTLLIYKQLPLENQNIDFLKKINQQTKTFINALAPNIRISKDETLYDLKESSAYLILFWSSTCYHCSLELPKIKDYLLDKPNITVVAVAVEEQESKSKWLTERKKYAQWKHIYSDNKWEGVPVANYNIHSTPSYFVLTKEKKIIAKPNNFVEIKALL